MVLSLATLVALVPELAAAPAPIAKSSRHVPTPETLLSNFQAEGFAVKSLVRGPEPDSYVIAIPSVAKSCLYVPAKTYVVRVGGADVRSAIRTCLERDREQTRLALSR